MAKNYRPIPIPQGVQLKASPTQVEVKGKLGALSIAVVHGLEVKSDGKAVTVTALSPAARVMVGTTRAHINNALAGVTAGFEKVMQVRGMGYRVQKTKDGIQIQCGYSHPVDIVAPKGITFDVAQVPNPDDTKQQMFEVSVKGSDRQAVGEVAARMRTVKPPEPYQGKGIRYRTEHIKKKAGKRAVATQA